jgi:uncharacterized protein YidB (DUF937 family)
MKTRWMIAGSLLTLAVIVATVALGGVVLAQRGGDEAAPETAADGDGVTQTASWHYGAGKGHVGLFGQHFMGQGYPFDDGDCDPLGHLAETLGLSTDELRQALAGGQTLAEIAEANGTSRQELLDALLAELDAHLAQAAGEGFFDQQQLDFMRDWLADGVALLLDHPLPVGEGEWEPGFYEGFHVHGWQGLLDAEDFDLPERLADSLGLTLQELVQALLDGQTLAEIAQANGVERQALVDFLVGEAEAELDEAVAADFLTPEQAQVLRGWVEDGVELLLDNSFAFPNLFDLPGRLEGRFGMYLGGLDWDKWAEFEWSGLIGRDPISVAAETIGLTRGELLAALGAGQTLAEVAEAHGVDAQAVLDAQSASVSDLLDELVAGGLIPEQMQDLITAHLDQGLGMFAGRGFPLGRHWESWGDAPHVREWKQEWFDGGPNDGGEGGE